MKIRETLKRPVIFERLAPVLPNGKDVFKLENRANKVKLESVKWKLIREQSKEYKYRQNLMLHPLQAKSKSENFNIIRYNVHRIKFCWLKVLIEKSESVDFVIKVLITKRAVKIN